MPLYKRLWSIIVLYAFMGQVHAQQGTRIFAGQIMTESGIIMKGLPVRLINVGPGKTGTDGIFRIPISNNLSKVILQVENTSMRIVYPAGGQASIPKDSNEVIKFVIGESISEIIVRLFGNYETNLKKGLAALGVEKNAIAESEQAFKGEFQQAACNLEIEKFNHAITVAEERRKAYDKISATVMDYLNQAKNVRDGFKFIKRHAYSDPAALVVLNGIIGKYNAAYDKLNQNYIAYLKDIHDLWDNEILSMDARQVFDQAIDEVHKINIRKLSLRINDINSYNEKSLNQKGKDKLKEDTDRDIENQLFELENRLEIFDARVKVLLQKLAP